MVCVCLQVFGYIVNNSSMIDYGSVLCWVVENYFEIMVLMALNIILHCMLLRTPHWNFNVDTLLLDDQGVLDTNYTAVPPFGC